MSNSEEQSVAMVTVARAAVVLKLLIVLILLLPIVLMLFALNGCAGATTTFTPSTAKSERVDNARGPGSVEEHETTIRVLPKAK